MDRKISIKNKQIIAYLILICNFIFIWSVARGIKSQLQIQNHGIYGRVRRDVKQEEAIDFKNACKSPAIEEFPNDFMTDEQRKQGGIILHLLIIFYMFGALAIACDSFFVKSLERISEDLKIKPHVAGASLMAAGSSAPELFTSVIGVTIAESDVGIGTIVGSAVFNVLFIVALCGLITKKPMKLDWYPITRDSLYYAISVATLIIVIYDEKVHWYEATVMLILYIIYIIIMYFNNDIERKLNSCRRIKVDIEEERPVVQDENQGGDDDDDNVPLNPFKIPKTKIKKILWLIFLPINLVFFVTVPDCRRRIFSRFPFYFLTFIMSTLYIALFSWIMVWMTTIFAYTIQIPDSVAGLTLLAIGTSLPEIVTSVVVTKKGNSDMAISNSIGSNVFDILVCLGLPWFISTLMIKFNSVVRIYSQGIAYSTIILFSTIVGMMGLIWCNRFYLNRKIGVILMIFWLIVTVITCLFELNIFGEYTLPACK